MDPIDSNSGKSFFSIKIKNGMDFAYVLINCDTGSEESIITQLKNMDSIKEVQGTLGFMTSLLK